MPWAHKHCQPGPRGLLDSLRALGMVHPGAHVTCGAINGQCLHTMAAAL